MKRSFIHFIALTLAAWSFTAGAEHQLAGPTEHDFVAELPVVLSVSRLAQPLRDTPASVTVIDREMINASGARQVWELMRLVPGFQSASVVGGSPVVTYHGLTEQFPRRVQVLVDGVSQYSPFFAGGVDWDLLPVAIDDIDRIEVIRGSNAAAYGSNAFMGVVNIISHHSADDAGFSLAGNAGGQGVRDSRLRWAGAVGPGSLRLTTETTRDDGLDHQFDNREVRRTGLRGDFRLGGRDELQIQLASVAKAMAVGDVGKPLSNNTDPPRTQHFENTSFLALWRHTLADYSDLALRYEHRREIGRDAPTVNSRLNALVTVVVPIDYGFASQRHLIEAQYTAVIGEGLRVVAGAGYRSDAVTSRTFFSRTDAVSLNVTRLFGNLEWRPNPILTTNFGATWERDSLSGTTFSPRLGLNFQVDSRNTLRVAAARAYRTPSLLEARSLQAFQSLPFQPLLPNGVLVHGFVNRGTPKAEQLDSVEAGYLGNFPELRLQADVRGFIESVRDRILFAQFALAPPNCNQPPALGCGAGNAAANFQDVRTRGLEVQLDWRPLADTRILLNQSFVKITSSYHDVPVLINPVNFSEIPRQTNGAAPTHTSSIMLVQRLPRGAEVGVTYQSVGALRWTNASYTSSYHRLDWRLAVPFRVGAQRGEVAFTAQGDGRSHGERDDRERVTPRGYFTLRLDI